MERQDKKFSRFGRPMKIDKVYTVSFSPTNNSKRVVNAIASGLQGISAGTIDLTYPDAVPAMSFEKEDLVIIGVPVYAGRVAPLAMKRLAGLLGDNTPSVIVVTYGNREFEDALIELKDFAESARFIPIAASAFVGEHSFSGPETPIAADRPDSRDLATAVAFGEKISKKLSETEGIEVRHCSEVPGNRPYKDGVGQLPFSPMLPHSKRKSSGYMNIAENERSLCCTCSVTDPSGGALPCLTSGESP